MNGDRHVRRQCPWCGRPDGDARLTRELTADDRELDVNRSVVALLVFHFGLGQRGLRARAPKDRLHRLVNQPFVHKNREGAKDFRFVLRIHGQVRIFPVAQHAEPLELLALNPHVFARERFGFFADFEW